MRTDSIERFLSRSNFTVSTFSSEALNNEVFLGESIPPTRSKPVIFAVAKLNFVSATPLIVCKFIAFDANNLNFFARQWLPDRLNWNHPQPQGRQWNPLAHSWIRPFHERFSSTRLKFSRSKAIVWRLDSRFPLVINRCIALFSDSNIWRPPFHLRSSSARSTSEAATSSFANFTSLSSLMSLVSFFAAKTNSPFQFKPLPWRLKFAEGESKDAPFPSIFPAAAIRSAFGEFGIWTSTLPSQAILNEPVQRQSHHEGNEKTYPQEHGRHCFHKRSDLLSIDSQSYYSNEIVHNDSEHDLSSNLPY